MRFGWRGTDRGAYAYAVCMGSGMQLQADVLFFHQAHGRGELQVAGEEDWFGIAVAEGLELAQPSGEGLG
jgi:hypothetical protein